jgi:hypothetical protein
MLSIEITRECPLSCPGCYAYGESHLRGGTTLRELNDLRGDGLVEGVLGLVRKYKPIPSPSQMNISRCNHCESAPMGTMLELFSPTFCQVCNSLASNHSHD